jgi:hypothetical protein
MTSCTRTSRSMQNIKYVEVIQGKITKAYLITVINFLRKLLAISFQTSETVSFNLMCSLYNTEYM